SRSLLGPRAHINPRAWADSTAPHVTHRRPLRGTHRASTRARVTVSFSDRMYELTTKTVKLVGPNGRSVGAKVALIRNGKKSRATAGADKVVLTPSKPPRRHAR